MQQWVRSQEQSIQIEWSIETINRQPFKFKRRRNNSQAKIRSHKSPILLPCNHSICREHLFAREFVRENKIKCSECQQEFKVKDNEYGPNQTLNRFIGDRVFLSEEEIILKKKLEETIRECFQFYNEFLQNKSKIESNVLSIFKRFDLKSMSIVRD